MKLKSHGFAVPGHTTDLLGISRDTYEQLGTPKDSKGQLRIPRDAKGQQGTARGTWGLLGLLGTRLIQLTREAEERSDITDGCTYQVAKPEGVAAE